MDLFSAPTVAADAAELLDGLALVIMPPPEERISEWAEGLIVVPGETGTDRPGPLSWDGFELLIEPLDRLHPDDPCRDVTFRGSAQIAKTFIGQVATYYYSSVTPRPWGVALPSTDEVLKYNRTKWQPVVDATPELKRKIRPVASRDEQGSTNTYKRFAGGFGQIFPVGSPKALQMVSLCLVIYEETPNWEREVGGRGDPRGQIRKRQLRWEMAGAKTFHNSTPGVKRKREDGEGYEGCPVTEDFDAGDQRRPYLPCPHCGDDEDGVLLQLDRDHLLGWGEGETPHFACPGCGGVIEHRHKTDMVRRCHPYRREPGRQHGGWLPTFESKDPENPAPGYWIRAREYDHWRARPTEGRQPSYTAWQIVSSAVDWTYVAAERRKAETGGKGEKVVYSQQIEGEAYEEVAQVADVDLMLEKRSERYQRGVVPQGYEQLTCAVDLNGDWAQWTVYGWGPLAEHVVVDKGRIDGSPSEGKLWREISDLMGRTWLHEDGGALPLAAAGVDSGYGTFFVYAFCRRFSRVKALDGAKGWGLMPLRRGPIQKLEGPDGSVVKCRTWRVGTWDLKRTLINEAIPLGCDGEASASVAGKPHWPMWLEKDYFEELTAEVLVEVQEKKTGVVKAEAWSRVRRRNEEMDLWVYNASLARSLGIGVPGSEPDWIELARIRRAGQLELEDLWDRPAHAVREVASDPAAGWGWKKRESA